MSYAKRIQRKRRKGWRMPEGAVYVGRPSKFGNPFAPKIIPGWATMSREYAVDDFRQWLFHDHGDTYIGARVLCFTCAGIGVDLRDDVLAAIPSLAGKDLACWCPLDQPCHADVLLELANGSST